MIREKPIENSSLPEKIFKMGRYETNVQTFRVTRAYQRENISKFLIFVGHESKDSKLCLREIDFFVYDNHNVYIV